MLRRLALSASLLAAACNPTLPPAPAHPNAPPAPRSTPIQLCWVEYSRNELPGSYGLAGQSDDETWEITYSGLLVRHPKGDVLIDAGNSSHFTDEIGTAGIVSSMLLRLYPGAGDVVADAPHALASVGEPATRLHAIAISHIHADHAGGVVDLPGVPVLLAQEELDYIRAQKDAGGFDVVRAHALAIEPRAQPVRFTGGPYENFDRSFNLFGDGTIVFVPLFGHTPGSMGTFVSRSPTERLFHVGDAVNRVEAIEKRRGKSVIMEPTDHDGAQADGVVARLSQLRAQDPAVTFLPAHDRAAWERAFGAPGRCVGSTR